VFIACFILTTASLYVLVFVVCLVVSTDATIIIIIIIITSGLITKKHLMISPRIISG